MNYIPLDHLFNYIPTPVRKMFSDDAQLKSWAMQAYRALNPGNRFTKDVRFLEVVNHRVVMPVGFKSIVKIQRIPDTQQAWDCISSLCEDIELPSNDSFADPCNIYLEHFIRSNCLSGCMQPVVRVRNVADDYLCRVDNLSNSHLYSVSTTSSSSLTFSFLEGTVAVEYWANIKDDHGEFLLPEEPEVLWMFLGKYAEFKFWDYQYVLNKEGAQGHRQTSQLEAAALRTDAKTAIIHRNIDAYLHRRLIYDEARILKIPTIIHRINNITNAQR